MAGQTASSNPFPRGHDSFGNAPIRSGGGIFWGSAQSQYEQSWEAHNGVQTFTNPAEIALIGNYLGFWNITKIWIPGSGGNIYDGDPSVNRLDSVIINGHWETIAKASEYGEAFVAARQLRMIEARESLKVMDKIGSFSRFASKYQRLTKVGGVLGKVNNVVTAYNTYSDVRDYNNGKLSGARLSYRLGGTTATIGTSTLVGTEAGGPMGTLAGFVTGLGTAAGEIIYDGWNNTVMPSINQGTYSINNEHGYSSFHP